MNEKRTILSPMQRLLGEDFNPALLLIMIRKSFAWCVIILLITISASLIYLRYTVPNYEVNASLIVKPTNTAQALDIQNTMFQSKNPNLDIEKDIQIMQSSVIIDRVIDSLPLTVSYFRSGNFLSDELYKNSPFIIEASLNDVSFYDHPVKFRFLSEKQFQLGYSGDGTETYETYDIGKQYSTPAFTFTASINEPNFQKSKDKYASNYFFIVNSRNVLYDRIRSALQIAPSAPTISMIMRDRKPQKAADIVNAVCEEFILFDREKKTESATLILDFIEAQVDSISNDLRKYEDQMTAFKLANGISISSLEQDLNADLKELKNKQDVINLQYSTLEYYRKYFLQYQDSSRLLYGIVDPEYEALNENIRKLDELQTAKKQMLLKLSPNNPEVINLNQQVLEVKKNVLQNIQNSEEKLRQNAEEVATELKKYVGEYSNVPGIQAEYLRLSRLSDLKEKYYLLLLDKKSAFSITKAGFVSDYTVLRRAEIPVKPISPNSPLIKLSGLIIGLIACFVLIVVRYLLHHKILSVADISRYTDASILGVIPKYRHDMEVSQLIVNKSPKSVISECFRSMRTNLEYISFATTPKLLTVTSTVAGEGKTFIAMNMAGILALGAKKVILLDFDLRKPQLHRAFGTDNQKGVSTLLIGKYPLEECIRHSEWENLDFITSGPLPPNPAEFIGSPKTDELIENLRQRYDVVVIDTPPAGIVTDALHLIKKADIPLYVLRADYSSRNYLNNVNHLINDHNITTLAVVLNDMGHGASMYHYDYGHSYGYGYGYGGSRAYGYDYYTDEIPQKRGLFPRVLDYVKSFF